MIGMGETRLQTGLTITSGIMGPLGISELPEV